MVFVRKKGHRVIGISTGKRQFFFFLLAMSSFKALVAGTWRAHAGTGAWRPPSSPWVGLRIEHMRWQRYLA
jgi:hypothetical protein